MAESLNRAWCDLLGILSQRKRLLDLVVEYFTLAHDVTQQAEHVENACRSESWGFDVRSVKKLIDVRIFLIDQNLMNYIKLKIVLL